MTPPAGLDLVDFVLVVDFADEIGVKRPTVYSLIRRRKIKAELYKGRLVIRRQEADRFAEEYALIRRRPARNEV